MSHTHCICKNLRGMIQSLSNGMSDSKRISLMAHTTVNTKHLTCLTFSGATSALKRCLSPGPPPCVSELPTVAEPPEEETHNTDMLDCVSAHCTMFRKVPDSGFTNQEKMPPLHSLQTLDVCKESATQTPIGLPLKCINHETCTSSFLFVFYHDNAAHNKRQVLIEQ